VLFPLREDKTASPLNKSGYRKKDAAGGLRLCNSEKMKHVQLFSCFI
jgi:hypothetical protein